MSAAHLHRSGDTWPHPLKRRDAERFIPHVAHRTYAGQADTVDSLAFALDPGELRRKVPQDRFGGNDFQTSNLITPRVDALDRVGHIFKVARRVHAAR